MDEFSFLRKVKELLDDADKEGLREEVLLTWASSGSDSSLEEIYKNLVDAYNEWVK